MNHRFGITVIGGTLIGLVSGIVGLLLLAPTMINNVDARLLGDGTARVESFFSVGSTSIELPHLLEVGESVFFTGTIDVTPVGLLSIFAAIGFGAAGLLTAAAIRWLPIAFDPDAVGGRRTGLTLWTGIVTGAIMGILFAQGVVVWFGTTSASTVEFPIVGGVLWGLLAGASIGGTVAGASHLLSRPDVVGIDELGWETPTEFRAATGRAMGVPVMALIAIFVVVGILGALFLAIAPELAHGEEAAQGSKAPLLIVASVLSAAILGVAAFLAYRPTSQATKASKDS